MKNFKYLSIFTFRIVNSFKFFERYALNTNFIQKKVHFNYNYIYIVYCCQNSIIYRQQLFHSLYLFIKRKPNFDVNI